LTIRRGVRSSALSDPWKATGNRPRGYPASRLRTSLCTAPFRRWNEGPLSARHLWTLLDPPDTVVAGLLLVLSIGPVYGRAFFAPSPHGLQVAHLTRGVLPSAPGGASLTGFVSRRLFLPLPPEPTDSRGISVRRMPSRSGLADAGTWSQHSSSSALVEAGFGRLAKAPGDCSTARVDHLSHRGGSCRYASDPASRLRYQLSAPIAPRAWSIRSLLRKKRACAFRHSRPPTAG